jgi:hypothetical protein
MSAVRTPGRSRVQVQWLVLAAALTVLAGLVVGWALTDAADRVEVIALAQPVPAGELFEVDDLTISQVAFDGRVTGLVPASSAADLVGRVATIDLEVGTLLTSGMWAEDTGLRPDERTVGAVLDPGRTPNGLSRGDRALAVSIPGLGAANDLELDGATVPANGPVTGSETGIVEVRVLETETSETGGTTVTLAVPEADAALVARLAATDALVLVGVPVAPTAVPTAGGATPRLLDEADDAAAVTP